MHMHTEASTLTAADAIGADKYEGCILGLALGDAYGAPHEGGPLERLLWRMIGTTQDGRMRWTDDTQMSLDIAESLLEAGVFDPDAVAVRFAAPGP
jgi:poly(ADP-ribose) glycohydrolase ARH3